MATSPKANFRRTSYPADRRTASILEGRTNLVGSEYAVASCFALQLLGGFKAGSGASPYDSIFAFAGLVNGKDDFLSQILR